MPRKNHVPSYRLHLPSGQAVVTLGGKDKYLGQHGSPESHAEYKRLVGEWLARSQVPVAAEDGLSMAELMVAYLKHAQTYYRDPDGHVTSEYATIQYALLPVEALYAKTPAKDFGPLALKAVRQQMIAGGLCRGVINQRIGHIKRMFKWASSQELVPPTLYHGLLSVDGLKRGRSEARETEPVKAVTDASVDAVLPFLSPTVKAMVRLQRLTGMRSSELVIMRLVDIDRSGSIWQYKPPKHKNAHHGHTRIVPLGPQAQELITPYLGNDETTYLFSPKQAQIERDAEKRRLRKTNVQPSQICRKKAHPKKQPRERYDRNSYYRAIEYGIKKARKAGKQVEDWHPHQLRHNAATRIRKERGLDAARAVLSQKSLAIADTYAELDLALASKVAAEMG